MVPQPIHSRYCVSRSTSITCACRPFTSRKTGAKRCRVPPPQCPLCPDIATLRNMTAVLLGPVKENSKGYIRGPNNHPSQIHLCSRPPAISAFTATKRPKSSKIHQEITRCILSCLLRGLKDESRKAGNETNDTGTRSGFVGSVDSNYHWGGGGRNRGGSGSSRRLDGCYGEAGGTTT